MNKNRLKDVLNKIHEKRILVIGDMGLDIYWQADMRKSRLARENPYHYLPIMDENISLGGGGNLTNCLAALCPNISVISVIGKDWKGREVLRLLNDSNVNTDNIILSEKWKTVAYGKIRRRGFIDSVVYEDPHLYFENYADMPSMLEKEILWRLKENIDKFDYIFVTDYQLFGVMTKNLRSAISNYGKEEKMIVVDSRDYLLDYHNVIMKPNDIEFLSALKNKTEINDESLKILFDKQNLKNLCVTLGEKGAVTFDGKKSTLVETKIANGEIDTVGAGDAFGAAFTAALSTGCALEEAAFIGNMASYIVIHKIGTTGVATSGEILESYK